MSIIKKAGLVISLLAICMFLFGLDMFTYNGRDDFATRLLGKSASEVGKYSFLYWLPTLIVGVTLSSVSFKKRNKNLR